MRVPRTAITAAVLACLAAAIVWAAPAATRPVRPPKPSRDPAAAQANPVGALDAGGLFRHATNYPPLVLAWAADPRVPQALGVFPHPLLPDRALVATRAGLVTTDDAAATWRPLAAAAAGQISVVRGVAFHPLAPDTFYLATDRKGIWATTDGGKTFQPIGSKQAGMAADETTGVYLYPGDRWFLTLLATHGDAAEGLSATRDAGKTWRVVAREYRVRQVVCGGVGDTDLFVVAAKKGSPDVQSIYFCPAYDDFWLELAKDLIPTDVGLSVLVRPAGWNEQVFHGAVPVFSTADAGLYRANQGGGQRIGPETINSFASAGFAFGPNADTEVLFAYEPRKAGLLVSTDGGKTLLPAGTGLYTGAFVKEGARVRANLPGTVFYATVNETLYVGRKRAAAFDVVRAAVTPAVFLFESEKHRAAMTTLRDNLREFTKARSAAAEARKVVQSVRDAQAYLSQVQFTVTAKVISAGGPPASVSVDLSRLGGSALTPLADDGAHGDGAAGDGTYGAGFRVDPRRFKMDNRDWRRRWPGPVGLTVTAVAADGKVGGCVAILSVFDKQESFTFVRKTEPVIIAGAAPWTQWCGDVILRHDIAGYHALTFWIKTDADVAEDVQVQLRDAPPFSLPTTTPPLGIVKEGFVDGGAVGREWRLVTIPVSRLLKDAPQFEAARLEAVILSGEGKVARTLWLDDIRFNLTPDDLAAYKGAYTP